MTKIKVLDRYIGLEQSIKVIQEYNSLSNIKDNTDYTLLTKEQIQDIINSLNDPILLECALSEVLENK